MKNDSLRIQSHNIKYTGGHSSRGPEWMASSELRLQESLTDETYTDGYIDYTHEL